MVQPTEKQKPLLLSAEEALSLLELCMLSQTDFDCEKESVLVKLSELVRKHLMDRERDDCTLAA
jgi:hypothetical protein